MYIGIRENPTVRTQGSYQREMTDSQWCPLVVFLLEPALVLELAVKTCQAIYEYLGSQSSRRLTAQEERFTREGNCTLSSSWVEGTHIWGFFVFSLIFLCSTYSGGHLWILPTKNGFMTDRRLVPTRMSRTRGVHHVWMVGYRLSWWTDKGVKQENAVWTFPK